MQELRIRERVEGATERLEEFREDGAPERTLREEELSRDIWSLLAKLKDAKPEQRSEEARRYAVLITEYEKVIAYFETFIYMEFDGEQDNGRQDG